ncbi:hypothetical protein HNQ94_003200 [Salirhabdus euzebyi]|uniref:Amidohydrolase 3 domain-containing protein n=1 Tax=Salirhabdus euzebyi TaxID=394506 RepID=A0A841Q8C3_9BACI|nr:amidohydrolase [Salirhabdus euzebyi]MBB6454711.1 hypothetical protein [Salirhabdus euzebyi]
MEDLKYADLVLSSNAIFTGLQESPFRGSVAIKDNVILATGTREEVTPLIGENTKVIEYGDQLIMPGFNDFHIHLFLGSLSQQSVHLHQAKSEQEAAEMVKEFADSRPHDEWIFGFRWYHVYWENKTLPHRSTLDRLIPDRPVFLFNDECHGAWVNTKALELLGINDETPNPPFGEIVRDKNGKATGFLYETAMTFASEVFENIPKDRQVELLENFLKTSARLGVTSISDMLPLPGLELGNLELYQEFDEQDKLTTRVHFLAALDGNLDRPKKLRETFQSDSLKFSGLKQFLDGVPIAYTAYLVDPYADKLETKGDTLIPIDYVREWAIEADRENFRIRFHACGDGAVRLGLDCFEAVQQQNGKRDSRHTIEHIEVIHPDDMNRFGELGVIASMQPEHMAVARSFANNTYRKRLGPEREKYTWPIKSLQDKGSTIAFGTDFPVVGLDPMTEIYRAVTRLHDDGEPEGGWNPSEKISLADALRAYTIGSAYGTFREQELGTLEAGKLADIIVLDQDLFRISNEDIRNTKVVLTVKDGKIIYQTSENKEV